MRKSLIPVTKVLCFTVLIIVLILSGFLLFLMITEYHPPATEKLAIKGKGKEFPRGQKELTFFTWNIGYGGLGNKMDFFYEGGERVKPDKAEFIGYSQGIQQMIRNNDMADFLFVQEIDVRAKRSHYIDEESGILNQIPAFCSVFAKNYDCKYVPFPIIDPMGRVVSGLATISKYSPVSAERISFTEDFSWPKRLFLLKRCFLVVRFNLTEGKQLVVINTHNSTYDNKGELRKSEFLNLHEFITNEFSRGNYVIAGGDWNNNPRNFAPEKIETGDIVKYVEPPVDDTFLPGWKFVFDTMAPTNRDVNIPYEKGKTKTTIIDFFVISPNVEFQSVKTITANFANSDHNPVLMKVKLK